jgi:hypothetical protein
MFTSSVHTPVQVSVPRKPHPLTLSEIAEAVPACAELGFNVEIPTRKGWTICAVAADAPANNNTHCKAR